MLFEQLLRETIHGNYDTIISKINENPEIINQSLNRTGFYEYKYALWRGSTLLIAAVVAGHIQIIKFLLNKGSNINQGDEDNWTPLHFASHFYYIDICNLLLSKGANLMLKSIGGKTALDVISNYRVVNNTIIKKGREIMLDSFKNGPLPDQKWTRRWPFMNMMVGCGFQPINNNKDAIFKSWYVKISSDKYNGNNKNNKDIYRELLQMKIFGHEGFWRIIASYL
jgi:ankyrin repeat protein